VMVSQRSGSKESILIVEDDRSLREGLAMNLRLQGYDVLLAANGDEGMRAAFDARPDLIVLDIMMPGWSGLDILEELRKRGQDVPVMMLSARGGTRDKVEGLNLGADDYMSKPFDLPELIARVEVMLRRRRTQEQLQPPLKIGDLEIDRSARIASVKGTYTAMSAKEFDLLCLFAESPGQVFSRDAILERVWGWDYEGTARTVDNFVASLRKKLGGRRGAGCLIQTVPRVGYRFDGG
jgi:two-component system alkaline phosphatase synthesis response regulator PhoP